MLTSRQMNLQHRGRKNEGWCSLAPWRLYDCVRTASGTRASKAGFTAKLFPCVSENGDRDFCLWHPHLPRADINYFGTESTWISRCPVGVRFPGEPGRAKVSRCRPGVVEDKPPTEDSAMFVYPFSMWADSTCTGNNAPRSTKRPAPLQTSGYLLQLPNNNDSFNPQNNKLHMPYRNCLTIEGQGPVVLLHRCAGPQRQDLERLYRVGGYPHGTKSPRQIQAALSSKPPLPRRTWVAQQTFEEKMRGIAVPYVTNRAIQNRLDEVVGPGELVQQVPPWIRFTV